mmetsp:Transcript_50550/g.120310  ORF Transcript_50550/g.120310 Transcript_50550/m.120310 type:complete len:228 (+) Transcript_50550:559-1242(+)
MRVRRAGRVGRAAASAASVTAGHSERSRVCRRRSAARAETELESFAMPARVSEVSEEQSASAATPALPSCVRLTSSAVRLGSAASAAAPALDMLVPASERRCTVRVGRATVSTEPHGDVARLGEDDTDPNGGVPGESGDGWGEAGASSSMGRSPFPCGVPWGVVVLLVLPGRRRARRGVTEGGVPTEGESELQEAWRRTAPREAPTSIATPSSVIPGLPERSRDSSE